MIGEGNTEGNAGGAGGDRRSDRPDARRRARRGAAQPGDTVTIEQSDSLTNPDAVFQRQVFQTPSASRVARIRVAAFHPGLWPGSLECETCTSTWTVFLVILYCGSRRRIRWWDPDRPHASRSQAGRGGHRSHHGLFQAGISSSAAGAATVASGSTATSFRVRRPISASRRKRRSPATACSPSSGFAVPPRSDGLGLLFNARGHRTATQGRAGTRRPVPTIRPCRCSCAQHPAARCGRPCEALAQGAKVIAEPTYGGQLQNFGAALPKGRMVIDYADEPVTLGDGTVGDRCAGRAIRCPTSPMA